MSKSSRFYQSTWAVVLSPGPIVNALTYIGGWMDETIILYTNTTYTLKKTCLEIIEN